MKILKFILLFITIVILSCSSDNSKNPVDSNESSSSSTSSLNSNTSSQTSSIKIDTIFITDSTGKRDTVILKDTVIIDNSSSESSVSSSDSTILSDSSITSSNSSVSSSISDSTSTSSSAANIATIDLSISSIIIDTIKNDTTIRIKPKEDGSIPMLFKRASGVGVVDAKMVIKNVIMPIYTTDSLFKSLSTTQEYIDITFKPNLPFIVIFGTSTNASSNSNNGSSQSSSVKTIDPSEVDSLYDLNKDPNKERLAIFSGDLKIGVMPRAKEDGTYYGIYFTFVTPTDSNYWSEGKFEGTISYNGITEKITGQYSSHYQVDVTNGDGIIFTFHFDKKIKLYTGVAW